jgi:short-subunit dehydrogenase
MKRSGRRVSTALQDYRGLRALVTGASSGIGRALALRLAGLGARVALVARRKDELERLAEEIRAGGGDAAVLPCDVSDAAQAADTAARASAAWGGIDLLVNNAGYGHHRTFLEWPVEDMERMMRVNYFGALYFTKALLPAMVEQRRGWLVFVASVAGKIAPPEESAYVATKFAMVGLAASLSLEVEDAGVHVLTVCPGVIRTPFFDAEALSRMAPAAKNGMVDVDGLVEAIIAALANGRHEITYPRGFGITTAYAIQAIAPEFMRRAVRRNTIDALAKARGR